MAGWKTLIQCFGTTLHSTFLLNPQKKFFDIKRVVSQQGATPPYTYLYCFSCFLEEPIFFQRFTGYLYHKKIFFSLLYEFMICKRAHGDKRIDITFYYIIDFGFDIYSIKQEVFCITYQYTTLYEKGNGGSCGHFRFLPLQAAFIGEELNFKINLLQMGKFVPRLITFLSNGKKFVKRLSIKISSRQTL